MGATPMPDVAKAGQASHAPPSASSDSTAPSTVEPLAHGALRPTLRRRARPALLKRPASSALVALVALAALTVTTELVVRATHVPRFTFPPPSAVLAELMADPELFLRAALVTLTEAAAGLLVGATAALVYAGVATRSQRLDAALTPLLVASQTIPVIALAPLLVLWMGYGTPPRVVVCALIAFFPMAVGAREGLRATDPDLLVLMRSIDARRWDIFLHVRLPAAAPYLTAGVRTGITLSLVGAVVAEWTGASAGLGYLVLSANARLATAQAFAAVLVITCIGLLAYGAALLLERRVCWWMPGSDNLMEKGPS